MLLDDVYTKMQDILQDTEIDDKYKLYGILKYTNGRTNRDMFWIDFKHRIK